MAKGLRAAIASAFLTAGLVAPSAAQETIQETAQDTGAAPANPAIWKVSDADSEFYVFGTFHILPPSLDWRSPPVAAALEAADVYWFEAPVDTPAARQATLHVLMMEGFNPQGETLSGMLGPEDAARLEKAARDVRMSMAALDPMRPWQAFLALTVQFIVSQGFDPGSGVESVLLKEARQARTELRFLETVEEQLALFTDLPPETEKKLLVVTLREWDSQAEQFDRLFAAWRDGDLDAIDEMMNESLRLEAPEVYETLVAKRNRAWTEEIALAMSGSGKALVAVGAAHLAGADSVIEMLAARGFSVERLDRADTAADEPGADESEAEESEDPIGEILMREDAP